MKELYEKFKSIISKKAKSEFETLKSTRANPEFGLTEKKISDFIQELNTHEFDFPTEEIGDNMRVDFMFVKLDQMISNTGTDFMHDGLNQAAQRFITRWYSYFVENPQFVSASIRKSAFSFLRIITHVLQFESRKKRGGAPSFLIVLPLPS